ncbi:siroheme synthase CysG [Ahrensia sp. R2A130]|uniref:siroheme synthase CysG n=1 Tax=Ahrensia sp. R2A130 TaxID=744979 RepID=UPI0001E0D7FD|nr:siroheme synthase CysG [Ahrensia sp. R2A130]EFL90317.1 siroheme synthase [Ahrensia sp. R2A130]
MADLSATSCDASQKFGDDKSSRMDVFPAFFKVRDREIVIVGGRDEAASKLRLVSETSARFTVIAEETSEAMDRAIALSGATLLTRSFQFEDLADAALVFSAMEDEQLDTQIVEAARMVGVPVNAVDKPHLCDFITPSIVNRAPVVVAVSTDGTAPVLARRIKGQVEKLLHPRTGALARFADAFRPAVARVMSNGRDRRIFWERFFNTEPARAVLDGREGEACAATRDLLTADKDRDGLVSLIGAGPGAEDLLTLRAHRVLQDADVVLHDALVPLEIVRMSRRDAEIISVGKRKGCHSKSQDEINRLMVEKAREGLKVVRLKSGDPMIFGRAGEELAHLRSHGIASEVVPGVTAALAGAAEAQLPLTLRGTASSVIFTTGHDLNGDHLPDWAQLALSGATITVYMGRTVARRTADRLVQAGLPSSTPVAVLENIGRSDTRRLVGTLADLEKLGDEKTAESAALIVIGEAVAGLDLDRCEPIVTATQSHLIAA